MFKEKTFRPGGILILAGMLVLFSCKKKSTTSAPPPPTSSSSGIYASLSVSKNDTLRNGSITGTAYGANAAFSCSANGYYDPSTQVSVDSIKFNGVSMWDVGGNYYDTVSMGTYTSPPHPITYPYTFKVVSTNCISSFTDTENGPYPAYTGYTNIPDTIYKSNGVTFPLTGISNADLLNVNFNDGTSGSGHELGQQFHGSLPSSVSFSSSDISQFFVSNKAILEVQLMKFNTRTYGGKQMMFGTLYTLTKIVSVK